MAIKRIVADAQVKAAGYLFVSLATKNLLVILRSPIVVQPNLWCGVGGKIEEGETPAEAALRESGEEIGFNGECETIPLYVHQSEGLVFHNFLGVVKQEFQPQLNWESSGWAWVGRDRIPTPVHPGLAEVFADPAAQEILSKYL